MTNLLVIFIGKFFKIKNVSIATSQLDTVIDSKEKNNRNVLEIKKIKFQINRILIFQFVFKIKWLFEKIIKKITYNCVYQLIKFYHSFVLLPISRVSNVFLMHVSLKVR